MSKPGDRVGAIFGSEGDTVEFFGYGIYEGDADISTEPCPVGQLADIMREIDPHRKNPRIKLDNGKVVWGCECWWGPEDRIKKSLENEKVAEKDIDEIRKEQK